MGDQLVENAIFQGLGHFDDGLLFARRSKWSILSEEIAGRQNQDAQQGEASRELTWMSMPPKDARSCGVSRRCKLVGSTTISASRRLGGQVFFVHLSFTISWQAVKLPERLSDNRIIGFAL